MPDPDSSSPNPRQQPSGPLAGLLVADFSRILAGPYATMLLADLGAEVVKVEGPRGDDTRTWQPPVRDGVSTYYLGVNRNKRSVALDLADPDDAAAAQQLARRADVLVENFKPGGLARFGLDYETVAAGKIPPPGPTAVPATPVAAASPAPGQIAAGNEETVTLDTDFYHVVLSNRGAVAHSWVLKQYKDSHQKPLEVVRMT